MPAVLKEASKNLQEMGAYINNIETYRKYINLCLLLYRFAVLPDKAKNGKFEGFLVVYLAAL